MTCKPAPQPKPAPEPTPKKPSKWSVLLQAIGEAIGNSKFGGQ